MTAQGFHIDRNLDFNRQAAAPTTPTEGNIYASADGLQTYRGTKYIPLARESDNLAALWGDCEAVVSSETRSAYTDATTARTASKWAYKTSSGAITAETTSELFGTQSYKALVTADGEFIETPLVTLPLAYVGKAVNLQFLLNTGVAAAVADYDVYVLRYGASDNKLDEVITVQGSKFLGIGQFQGFFISSSVTDDLYSIVVVYKTTPDVTLTVDQFYIGQKSLGVVPAMTDWVAFTPSIANLTVGSGGYSTGYYRQVGDSVQFIGAIKLGTSPTVGALALTLPNSWSMDTAKLAKPTGNNVGIATVYDWDTSKAYNQVVTQSGTSATALYFLGVLEGEAAAAAIDATHPITFVALDFIEYAFTIPIVGKTSGITALSNQLVEYVYNSGTWDAADSTSFAYGAQGGDITGTLGADRTKRVRFQTVIGPTDMLVLEGSADRLTWYPINGGYMGSYVTPSVLSDGSAFSGCYLKQVGTTDLDILFGRYTYIANDDAPLGSWANGYFWRVKKISQGGLGIMPISARNVVGDVTGSVVPAGLIGEVISSTISATGVSTEADVTGASLALTPGRWRLIANVTAYVSTGATVGNASRCVVKMTDSANTQVGLGMKKVWAQTQIAAAATAYGCLVMSEEISIAAAATYKLRALRADEAGTGTAAGVENSTNSTSQFYAVRIA